MAVVSRVGLPGPTRAIELGSGSHGLNKAILLERGTANDRYTLGLGGLEECHQPLRLLVALDDPSTIMDRPGRSASLGSASGARFVTHCLGVQGQGLLPFRLFVPGFAPTAVRNQHERGGG